MHLNTGLRIALAALTAWLLAACSATKYVPDGSYLLDDVHIKTDNREVRPSDLHVYLRQVPNSKWFSLVKTQLYVYNWSGPDSTKWINRVLRRMGDAPVVYSETDSRRTAQEIRKAVQNMGYMGATVQTVERVRKKKIKVTYLVHTGQPYTVGSIRRDVRDTLVAKYLAADSAATLLREGMRLDINLLDAERNRITSLLQRKGYYRFNKDYISYTADTVRGTFRADLTLQIRPFRRQADEPPRAHPQYRIGRVSFITDYDALESTSLSDIVVTDSIHYQGFPIYYKDELYLRPSLLANNLRLEPDSLYDDRALQRTYSNFGRLQALKYTNVRFFESQADSSRLNAYVLLTKSKHKSVSFELEGTNSAGDLGAAASVSFQHRNLFKGSEALVLKLRGAYEAVSGLQGSQYNSNYTELGAEATIDFPQFVFPFLSKDFKRRINASTEFGLQYNYQMRPEFTRITASAGWSYKWGTLHRQAQHRIDLLDLNYLYMPWIDEGYRQAFLEDDQNYILQYNYENRLIMSMGYTFSYHSDGRAMVNNTLTGNSYALRLSFESAGNLLYGISKMAGLRRNGEGEYTVLNIPYAQYVKADFDFSKQIVIDNRNSLAFHLGAGVVVPYGNATMVPFEKRYFSGGANSVRGWSVRDLGPGSFPGDGNFLNQSGDVKLDASVEYRTRLFWKFRGAVFVDAGNIWTLRNYEDQPGGQFKFNKFYKQIAVAYGLGLRLDLGFFVLRFDGGMKAINPVYETGRERYPIVHPDFGRDFAFHFAVGYPF